MATRTAPLVGAPLHAGHATGQLAYSSKPVLSDLMRILGGNERTYHELITGVVQGGQPSCAKNSRGLVGEDHSGAGYGRPLLHTPYTMCFVDDDNGPRYMRSPPQKKRDGSTSPEYSGANEFIWVDIPACYPGGAYESLRVDVWVRVPTSENNSNCTGHVYVMPDGGEQVDLSFDMTSAGDQTGNDTLRFTPGRANRVRIKVTTEYSTASGDSTLQLLAVSFSNVSDS